MTELGFELPDKPGLWFGRNESHPIHVIKVVGGLRYARLWADGCGGYAPVDQLPRGGWRRATASDKLNAEEYSRLREWAKDPQRKRADIAFTQGKLRDAADAVYEFLCPAPAPPADKPAPQALNMEGAAKETLDIHEFASLMALPERTRKIIYKLVKQEIAEASEAVRRYQAKAAELKPAPEGELARVIIGGPGIVLPKVGPTHAWLNFTKEPQNIPWIWHGVLLESYYDFGKTEANHLYVKVPIEWADPDSRQHADQPAAVSPAAPAAQGDEAIGDPRRFKYFNAECGITGCQFLVAGNEASKLREQLAASEKERAAIIPAWAREERCAVCGAQAVEKFSQPCDPKFHPNTHYLCAIHFRKASEDLSKRVFAAESELATLKRQVEAAEKKLSAAGVCAECGVIGGHSCYCEKGGY